MKCYQVIYYLFKHRSTSRKRNKKKNSKDTVGSVFCKVLKSSTLNVHASHITDFTTYW